MTNLRVFERPSRSLSGRARPSRALNQDEESEHQYQESCTNPLTKRLSTVSVAPVSYRGKLGWTHFDPTRVP